MKTSVIHSSNWTDEGIGGKAKNLIQLEKAGATVPRWAVIPQHILLDQISEGQSEDQIQNAFKHLLVPEDIIPTLKAYFGDHYDSKTYAVRSSAIDEDGSQFSFAGQFETYLHVSFSELEDKIKAIWQSAVSERVIAYRKTNHLPLLFGIGVIIQEMIDSEVSGVAFGANPVSNDINTKVVSSVYGLGEGLVSGELDADTYTLTPDGVEEQLTTKKHAFVKSDSGKGISKTDVAEDRQNVSSLNADQLNEIAALLDNLNHALDGPQDIEFTYQNDTLYLLQTRPITTIKTKGEKGEYTLWDNSNIIESYPGITTPLTFSFIIKMYEMVYRQFVGIMGVKQHEIDRHADVFANTLGLVRGRVYYNLLNWYKMLAMLPGYSINAENMERMMGVKERFELDDSFQMSKGLARFRIVGMVIKMIRMQIRLPKERQRFLTQLNGVMNQYKSIDFSTLSTSEIVNHYNTFERTLLLKWKAPLINDFFAMIWFGLLEKQAKKWCPDETNIHNDLLCGSQDIISVEPIHKSIEIASQVITNPDAKVMFSNHSPAEIWSTLNTGVFVEIKTLIDQYIQKFGDRCVGELKLETISYIQRPELFVKVIKSYVEQGITKKATHSNLEDELRTKAEQKIFSVLKGKPIRKWWFKVILNKARDLVSNRENLRYERTRGFGMVRHMFSELGEQFFQSGDLQNSRDIFYLTLEEIQSLENHPLTDELKANIQSRKVEFETYKTQPAPQERFFTYGNDFSNEYIYSLEKVEGAEENLSGIGCCPGIVQGKVRVVMDPNETDSLNGDILVTSSTDPGWVTLFPTASAIIVERGSLLSHSAIVSREMGIPCIVSVTGLLRTLKSGDEILMDGSTGVIKQI